MPTCTQSTVIGIHGLPRPVSSHELFWITGTDHQTHLISGGTDNISIRCEADPTSPIWSPMEVPGVVSCAHLSSSLSSFSESLSAITRWNIHSQHPLNHQFRRRVHPGTSLTSRNTKRCIWVPHSQAETQGIWTQRAGSSVMKSARLKFESWNYEKDGTDSDFCFFFLNLFHQGSSKLKRFMSTFPGFPE